MMHWKLDHPNDGPLPCDIHVEVNGDGVRRHRYVLALDPPEASHMDLLDGGEQSAVAAAAAALVSERGVADRPAPEPTVERTSNESRSRNYPNWGTQMEAVTEQLFAMADAGIISLAPKLSTLRGTINAVKNNWPHD
jgi:hypothetical protein